jgi:hypothetical protein
MATANKDWIFVAQYVSSGNIPGAKLFHTEDDFDNMPEEIHNAGYGGWASGEPWGVLQVETADEAIERLKKLIAVKNSGDFMDTIDEISVPEGDVVVSPPDNLVNCEVWWAYSGRGDTPFVACLKNQTEFGKLDGWFDDMKTASQDALPFQEENEYNVFQNEELSRGDMEGGTSELYTAAQIIESAEIQEELMS